MYLGDLPPASNRAGYAQVFTVIDDDTDEALDLSAASIVFEIRDPTSFVPILSASTANGKVGVIDRGTFQVTFSAGDMTMLAPDTYDVGCTIANGAADPQQFIIGTLAVLDGVVSGN
ncbi:MAG TPA: hypothetical protein VFB45_10525 [Pseudolabrys sp.]|nr:hypothetical protein [Pseudolabrys sp.]